MEFALPTVLNVYVTIDKKKEDDEAQQKKADSEKQNGRYRQRH